MGALLTERFSYKDEAWWMPVMERCVNIVGIRRGDFDSRTRACSLELFLADEDCSSADIDQLGEISCPCDKGCSMPPKLLSICHGCDSQILRRAMVPRRGFGCHFF